MRFTIRAVMAAASAVAAAAAMSAVAAPTAQAASSADCASGKVCLFEGAGYTGGILTLGTNSSGLPNCEKYLGDNYFSSGTLADNNASSVINNSGTAVVSYNKAQWPSPQGDWYFIVSAGGRLSSLTQTTSYWGGSGSDGRGYTVNMNDSVSAAC
ncbi:peptidase inhibitor family I36 protein [Kineosporia sp. NBRC 101731]|uniref:peptidase inhibitor family I36 protein n=1 Tax=Kineosporia sp. NBRC 101731 TaxID=3032199 RepID=UPI0024A00E61|nr:peptidase inhibitor family I36 protein [Kineosporia sp. NBRC 101731]GLY28868.1 hypothetical protein Kisp02_22330 [Kineosporia sp. NBRC 101731]